MDGWMEKCGGLSFSIDVRNGEKAIIYVSGVEVRSVPRKGIKHLYI